MHVLVEDDVVQLANTIFSNSYSKGMDAHAGLTLITKVHMKNIKQIKIPEDEPSLIGRAALVCFDRPDGLRIAIGLCCCLVFDPQHSGATNRKILMRWWAKTLTSYH